MDLLYEIISDGIIESFNVNEEFLNVFGNHDFELLSNEKSIRFCDIDIILENVVLTKNKSFISLIMNGYLIVLYQYLLFCIGLFYIVWQFLSYLVNRLINYIRGMEYPRN